MSEYYNNAIYWIDVEKIKPNPYQPRVEFDQRALQDLSDSIKMYGLLQPLVVTRKEVQKEDGGLATEYELISGERRLRASKLAGLKQVAAIIRAHEDDAKTKLELAIIENLQREDLNAVDRARAFQRLADEFGFKHTQIAEKVGKSREYVTNSIRLLALPPHMLQALSEKKITEGHTRPLLMLVGREAEQETLFKEIMFKKITVREAERISRTIATEKVRRKDLLPDPELTELEGKLNESLGTRVSIERREQGGKVVIDFFSNEDLKVIIDLIEKNKMNAGSMPSFTAPSAHIAQASTDVPNPIDLAVEQSAAQAVDQVIGESNIEPIAMATDQPNTPVDDSTPADSEDDAQLYAVKNFSL